jgi:hypothetical protein
VSDSGLPERPDSGGTAEAGDGGTRGTVRPSGENKEPAQDPTGMGRVARVYWIGLWSLFSTIIGGIVVGEVLAHPGDVRYL